MKQNISNRKGLILLLPVLFLTLMLLSSGPIERQKNVYNGEQFTVHYETWLGRLDGHYVSYYSNGTKRSEGYFESNHRAGIWTVWDSAGRIIAQRQYTDPFSFIPLSPAVSDDQTMQQLSSSPYSLSRNEHNFFSEFHLEERMVIYATRVWRQLAPENNRHIFQDNLLFNHMLHHARKKDITLYQDEDFWKPDTTTCNPELYDVIAFKVVEDRVFDTERYVSEARIISICPVVVDRESLDTLDLFWIYLPRYRRFLAQQPVTGNDIPEKVEHLDDLFFFRTFHGEIYKSDNVYDRVIADYKHGEEIALEAQRIEISLVETEHDVWIVLTH